MRLEVIDKKQLNNRRLDEVELGRYLKSAKATEVIMRTTYIEAGWHDVEFAANRAGYKVCRFINNELNGFKECYRFSK